MTAKGVLIVGLNGSGKTTLGRALAERLGWFRMDVEDYYFPDMTVPYANARSEDEVRSLMLADMRDRGNFVLSSVRADWGVEITGPCALAVCLRAPLEVRMARIDQRERLRFGDRVLPGGDMYERQRRFHALVASRDEGFVENSLAGLNCPCLIIDGTQPIGQNIECIIDCCVKLKLVGKA